MSNNYFQFKQFTVYQDKTAMKVGVDSVVLGAWTKIEKVKSILDIGAGTGLLSLMLAQKSEAKITAVEIDASSYNQAVENVTNSKWGGRIDVIHSSFQEFVNKTKDSFDLIICNPPYFVDSLKSPKENRNTARHDDYLSLDELFSGSKEILSENGRLNLIYPYQQKANLMGVAENYGFYPIKLIIIRGNENKNPNRIIVEFKFIESKIETEELCIRNLTNDYTKEYKNLTGDYYLKF
ncbi:MAG: tRNA (adenosine(37)-N6)-methyltransferase TrmM [Bacteroidetes bacterium]|nr:MAG: tRNA (adenosine(37)-N6)-methyltransferase TrmM [Bacteroidota bacterium]